VVAASIRAILQLKALFYEAGQNEQTWNYLNSATWRDMPLDAGANMGLISAQVYV
jgi:hypothetical protein